MTKLVSLVIALLLSASLFAGTTYEECLGDFQTAYQAELKTSKIEFDRDYKYCFKFPVGDQFDECTYEAYKAFNDANKVATDRYFAGMKYCQKYPVGF